MTDKKNKEMVDVYLRNLPKRTFDFIAEMNAEFQKECLCNFSRTRTVTKIVEIAREALQRDRKNAVGGYNESGGRG